MTMRKPHLESALLILVAAFSVQAEADWFGKLFDDFDTEGFHDEVSQRILERANQIDSWFGEGRIDEEAQQTRVRAYTDIEWDDEDGADIGAKLRVHLVLPNTRDRLRLEFNGSDDDEALNEDQNERESQSEERERTLGVNLKTSKTRRMETDLGLGLRYRNSSLRLYEKARHRVYFTGEKWLPRLTNEIRHYGDTGFEYRGQLDFDRAFSETWFLRSRTEARWYENDDTDQEDLKCNDGYCINQFFFFYQRFADPKHAIAYDWLNYFVTEPDNQLDEVQLRIRYRHRLKWDWLHFEVQPRVRLLEDTDYDARWSLLFRLEGIFGYDPSSEIQFK